MTIDTAIRSIAEKLRKAGVTNALREASSLVRIAVDRPATFLIAHPEYILTQAESRQLDRLADRRARRIPLQHLTRKQEFYGLEFEVSPDVLIPRPETEILVEKAIELLPKGGRSFLELGVGSGCISVSILHQIGSATAVGIDKSPLALAVARSNAVKHGVTDRLDLIESDLFDKVSGRFDLIVSNPPYIPDRDITSLQAEVRDFEPLLALAGGGDGLDVIRKIIKDGQKYLESGGWLLMEIGYGQSSAVRNELQDAGWEDISFLNDLQAIPRVAMARHGA